MLSFFDPLRELSFLAILTKLLLAMACGGIIGLEREYKRRPAGFRTHILICIGAAITTLISEYLAVYMHYYTDMARLGAQVIAGIGFIGAGTILKRGSRIKGLTTAAGLWTSGIVGLCLGAGYFEAAVITTALTEVAELLFAKLEYRLLESSPQPAVYVEYSSKHTIEKLLLKLRSEHVLIENLEITQAKDSSEAVSCAILYLNIGGSILNPTTLLETISEIEGVVMTELL
ncbi:MAG: MgtC/SapB family protein [Lachnospiraceae bacterium]|nr:MgtC/SapB family protein [Lachnospiraceae bacterium]